MIARLTRILLLLQLLATVALARFCVIRLQVPAMAALPLALGGILLLRLLIVAHNFATAWHYRSKTPPACRLDWRRACALFFGEFGASMLASSWLMPFRAFSTVAVPAPRTRPVLLLHGYACNSGYWRPMSEILRNAGIAHRAINLEPIASGIDDYVPLIHAAVENMCRESGCRHIVIVAHSMGGLAARAYLRAHGEARIAKAITLGTPHHGTALARFGIGINTAQMRWIASEQEGLASEWLRELSAQEEKSRYRLFVSLYSHHDNIVAPQASSHLEGATNIEFCGIGHVALGFHPAVQQCVIREILKAAALPFVPAG